MAHDTPQEITNRSSSITIGGTAQNVCAANTNRRGWSVQNLSAENLYVNDLGTAHATDGASMTIQPGGYLCSQPNEEVAKGAISIIGATTGSKFYAREW